MSTHPTRQVNRVCPVLLVRDVPASLAFYRDKLGFEPLTVHGDPPEFAIVGRDLGRIVLRRADKPMIARNRHHVAGGWFYDAVFFANGPANVDALHAEFTAAGVEGVAPVHTENGMRVFSFLDPDGYKFWVHAALE